MWALRAPCEAGRRSILKGYTHWAPSPSLWLRKKKYSLPKAPPPGRAAGMRGLLRGGSSEGWPGRCPSWGAPSRPLPEQMRRRSTLDVAAGLYVRRGYWPGRRLSPAATISFLPRSQPSGDTAYSQPRTSGGFPSLLHQSTRPQTPHPSSGSMWLKKSASLPLSYKTLKQETGWVM